MYKRQGLTQQAMADKLGISLRYYQRIECGGSGGSFEIWEDVYKRQLLY